MNHKIGDKVKVKSIEWYNTLPKEYELIYGIREKGGYDHFVEDMSEYCGRIVEISEIVEINKHEYYRIKEDYEEFYWSDYMFEEEVEESNEKINGRTITFDYTSNGKDIEIILNNEWTAKIGDNGNVVLKQKPKYPETYKECCEVLGIKEENISFCTHSLISDIKFKNLYKLYICRNAYWKITDYKGPESGTEFCWLYYNTYNREIKTEKGTPDCSMFMSFPNEYVADKFIKYFGNLLEDCKEFL